MIIVRKTWDFISYFDLGKQGVECQTEDEFAGGRRTD